MSTIHLIRGSREDAIRMSKRVTEFPNLAIDPIDNVSLAKLLQMLTADRYDAIIRSFTDMTPEQPEVEPWDLDNLIFPVCLIPERYVSALANMPDEDLPKLAKKWRQIEELKPYRFDVSDLQDQLASFREFAAKCIEGKHDLLILLAP